MNAPGNTPQVNTADDRAKKQLIAEINEQIPFLAYGLSERIHKNGLQGKISIFGMPGDSWGIGVSHNNPRKDIPNVIIYPESMLADDRALTNARLRHEIGNLNHAPGKHLHGLKDFCHGSEAEYQLLLPLVEAIQEASVNYLEMQNSFAADPAAAFRPLYDKAVDVRQMANRLAEKSAYAQAVDLTLLKALAAIDLIPREILQTAESNADSNVMRLFTPKINGIILQAVKTASPRIKIQLVCNYLWRTFADLLPEDWAETALNAEPLTENTDNAGTDAKNNPHQKQTDLLERAMDALQNQLETAEAEDKDERQPAIDELLQDLRQTLEDENNDTDFEDLQALLDPKKNDDEPLDNLTYKIDEVGIERDKLTDVQLDLLGRIHNFCRNTTEKYVRTMRFLMANYQQRNPQFTDEIINKIISRHHDTPLFTIYSEETGNEFLQAHEEQLRGSGMEYFHTHSFMLNINLPPILGRFGYHDINSKERQLRNGAIDWEHFHLAALPTFWIAADYAPDDDMLFKQLNPPHNHRPPEYFYLYEIINFPADDFHLPPSDDAADNRQEADEPEDEIKTEENNDSSSGEQGQNENSPFDNDNPSPSGDSADPNEQGGHQTNSSSFDDSASPNNSQLLPENDNPDPPDFADNIEEPAEGSLDEKIQQLQEQLENDKTTEILQQLEEIRKMQETAADETNPDDIAPIPEQHTANQTADQGGQFNRRAISQLFNELAESREQIKSQFEDSEGNLHDICEVDIPEETAQEDYGQSVEELKALKDEQSRRLEALYTEQSGLSGEALKRYVEYREETKDFVHDLTEFFTNKFSLDVDFDFMQNQWHGNRMQHSWTHKLIGIKNLRIVMKPTVFERRTIPKNTQFVWSVIIDNSASCSGEIIEEEKKTAIALVEVAKQLKIPLEILVFGDSQSYTFLKTFDQELFGEQLAAIIRLNADNGTPDVATLAAACGSIADYTTQFNRSYNFVYFMTDGKSGSGSIQSVIQKYRRDMVITGIGLADGADSIQKTWGSNAVSVHHIKELSHVLIRKIETQIEDIFD